MKNIHSFRNLWAIPKDLTFVTPSAGEEEEGDRPEKVFKEIMSENFLNLAKDINLQIKEAE